MATFMRKLGHTYDTASNGLTALEKYKSCDRRFDFVLMGQYFFVQLDFLLVFLANSTRHINARHGWSRFDEQDTRV